MATLHYFDCEACHYRAEVSGGEDCGMVQATTTICCTDCQQLFDVPISDDAITGKPEHEIQIRCPNSWSHRWRLWRHPDACPRCGTTTMTKGSETVIWD